ncbi:MAG: hypothetical protein JW991_01755 [Candidatus Pacebacteria bacterium]|nr:hypothetical protein [Candidatus Paceibacterota bacterium]
MECKTKNRHGFLTKLLLGVGLAVIGVLFFDKEKRQRAKNWLAKTKEKKSSKSGKKSNG